MALSVGLWKVPECSICYTPLLSRLCVLNTCGHVFHEKCAQKWFESKRIKCPCPLCRTPWTLRSQRSLSFVIEAIPFPETLQTTKALEGGVETETALEILRNAAEAGRVTFQNLTGKLNEAVKSLAEHQDREEELKRVVDHEKTAKDRYKAQRDELNQETTRLQKVVQQLKRQCDQSKHEASLTKYLRDPQEDETFAELLQHYRASPDQHLFLNALHHRLREEQAISKSKEAIKERWRQNASDLKAANQRLAQEIQIEKSARQQLHLEVLALRKLLQSNAIVASNAPTKKNKRKSRSCQVQGAPDISEPSLTNVTGIENPSDSALEINNATDWISRKRSRRRSHGLLLTEPSAPAEDAPTFLTSLSTASDNSSALSSLTDSLSPRETIKTTVCPTPFAGGAAPCLPEPSLSSDLSVSSRGTDPSQVKQPLLLELLSSTSPKPHLTSPSSPFSSTIAQETQSAGTPETTHSLLQDTRTSEASQLNSVVLSPTSKTPPRSDVSCGSFIDSSTSIPVPATLPLRKHASFVTTPLRRPSTPTPSPPLSNSLACRLLPKECIITDPNSTREQQSSLFQNLKSRQQMQVAVPSGRYRDSLVQRDAFNTLVSGSIRSALGLPPPPSCSKPTTGAPTPLSEKASTIPSNNSERMKRLHAYIPLSHHLQAHISPTKSDWRTSTRKRRAPIAPHIATNDIRTFFQAPS